MPRTLDTELLDELERRLRDRSAVFFDRLRPGLGDEEIDRLSAPLMASSEAPIPPGASR
jgi:hypothetical protein